MKLQMDIEESLSSSMIVFAEVRPIVCCLKAANYSKLIQALVDLILEVIHRCRSYIMFFKFITLLEKKLIIAAHFQIQNLRE